MTLRRLLSSASVALALAALASDASAVTSLSATIGGTACRPRYQSWSPNVTYEDRGAGNFDASPQEVFCPVSMTHACPNGGQFYFDGIAVRYQDNSSTSYFTCYMYQTDFGGWQLWTAPKYTCSAHDGCSYATAVDLSTDDLYFATPIPSRATTNWGVACSIAGSNGTWGGVSWIFGLDAFYRCVN